jgi:hypothetical protein
MVSALRTATLITFRHEQRNLLKQAVAELYNLEQALDFFEDLDMPGILSKDPPHKRSG